MSERLECAVCGYPLGHIDEACPRCLPGFYTPEYRGLSAENAALKARVEELEAEIERLRTAIREYAALQALDLLRPSEIQRGLLAIMERETRGDE